jgi:hypothetical protein
VPHLVRGKDDIGAICCGSLDLDMLYLVATTADQIVTFRAVDILDIPGLPIKLSSHVSQHVGSVLAGLAAAGIRLVLLGVSKDESTYLKVKLLRIRNMINRLQCLVAFGRLDDELAEIELAAGE